MIKKLLFGAIFLLVVILALLPTFFSSDYGKNVLISYIEKRIQGSLEIGKLQLSWLGTQKIENLVLYDQNHQQILSIPNFSTQSSLLRLLINPYHLKKTEIYKPALTLIEDAQGVSNFSRTVASKKKKEIQLQRFKGEIYVQDATISITTEHIQSVIIKDLKVDIQSKPALFHVAGNTEANGVAGSILAKGSFEKELRIEADITSFPLAAIDTFCDSCLFVKAIGQRADVKLTVVKTASAASIDAHIIAPNLKGHIVGTTQGRAFTIDPSSQFVFTLTPALFNEWVKESGWQLASSSDIVINLEQCSVSSHKKLPLKLNFSLTRSEIVHEQYGNFSLNNVLCNVQTCEKIEMHCSADIHSAGGNTTISGELLFGEKPTYSLNIKAFPTVLFGLFFKDNPFASLGERLDATLNGTYDEKNVNANVAVASSVINIAGTLTGTREDLKLNLQGKAFTPKRYQAVFGTEMDVAMACDISLKNHYLAVPKLDLLLKSPIVDASIRGKIGKEGEPFSFENVLILASGNISSLHFQGSTFESGTLFARLDGSKNLLLAQAHMYGAHTLDLDVQASDMIVENALHLNKAKVLLEGKAHNLPLTFIQALLDTPAPLAHFFGEALNLQFECAYTPEKHEHLLVLNLNTQGEGLKVQGQVALNGTFQVDKEQPFSVYYEITPKRYQAWLEYISPMRTASATLLDTASLELAIHDLTCPATSSATIKDFLCQSGFGGAWEIKNLIFQDKVSREQLKIKHFEGSILSKEFAQGVGLIADAKLESSELSSKEQSTLHFEGYMSDFWTQAGGFKRENLKIKGNCSLDLIPVKALLQVIPMQESSRRKADAILGDFLNARIAGEIAKLTGPLTFDIKSSNLKVLFPGYLDQGFLKLEKSIEMELTLTPQVSEMYLASINPFFLTGANSEHPVKLYIDAQNFVLPLHPFQLQGVQIQSASIDIGRIYVRNGGQLQSLMDLLKAKNIAPDGTMEAWLTPVYFSLEQGVLSYKRFDMLLAKSVHISLWGSVDLIHDRVNMVLGVSPTTLQKKFNLAIFTKQDMFQIPVSGSTSKLKVDWNGAGKRLGIIIAKSSGAVGSFFGGLLEQVLGVMGEAKTPPPTTYPYPWESDYPEAKGD